MSETYLDRLLDELVPAEAPEGWDDVRHRARRSQRRYVSLVVAVAVLVLAPATWAAWKAFEGTPAPRPVRHAFGNYNEWARQFAKQWPQVKVRKAHGVLRVKTKDGPYALWAAPLSTGGVCYIGALERDGRPLLSRNEQANCIPKRPGPTYPALLAFADPTDGGQRWDGSAKRGVLWGYAKGRETTVQVTRADGRTTTLRVVEHFFLMPLPDLAERLVLTGRDANGRVIARGRA
ncbi:MAG: hypothetical protein QOG85_344 [Gaiellaceae bacterium]|jgi:hypothetical protein|nr:hypothetical protein [Gaiellaceae bacterium]